MAARRLGITLARFEALLPALRRHGFPQPDAITGNYDLEAIDRYIDLQNILLLGKTTSETTGEAESDNALLMARIAAMSFGPRKRR